MPAGHLQAINDAFVCGAGIPIGVDDSFRVIVQLAACCIEGSTSTLSRSQVKVDQTVTGAKPELVIVQFEGALDQPMEPMGVDGVSGEWKILHFYLCGGQKWSSVNWERGGN